MRLVATLILIVFSFSGYTQVLTVKANESGKPLEMVTITSENPNFSVVTNSKGQADITSLKGSDLIEIRIMGYTSQHLSFTQIEQLGFEVSMATSIFSIDQVVVSATKWTQTAREIPLKITPISRSQIVFHNPQTAADLLTISGDVFVQKSQQGGGSPMIRGFATNRLLIAVDGVRMNNAIFRGGNLQNVISLDPFAVEQAEVLFGPGSVIYGSDAIGGVMSFYTLSPRFSDNGKVLLNGNASARYSSANNEKTGHFDINLGFSKWALLSSLSYTDFGDLRMGSYGPQEYLRSEYVDRQGNSDIVVQNSNPRFQRPTGYSQTNIMQKISYKPNSSWVFDYGLHYSSTSNFDRYDRLIYYRDGFPRSAEWFYGPQIWLMSNLKISSKASTVMYDQLTLQLAYQYFQESRNDRNFNGNLLRKRVEKVDAFSFNVDFKKRLNPRQSIIYGAEVVDNYVTSTGIDRDIVTDSESVGPSRYPQAQWSSIATYLTFQRKLVETVDLHAGVRHTHFLIDAQFDNAFYTFPFTQAKVSRGAVTGSVGLTLNPTEQWRVKGVLSTGFRAPNVDDIGKVFDSEPGSVVVPNPNLKAEYAYNAEVGVTRRVADFLEIDFLTYVTLLDNAMVKRESTLNGLDSIMYDGQLSRVQSLQNASFARVWGFQADFELMLPSGFLLSSRFNYQNGVEELDNGTISPLRHAAPWFGVTRLSYRSSKLMLSLFANYSGTVPFSQLADEERGKPYIYAIDGNGNPYSPGWYTINFRANYRISEMVGLSIDVENLTDQRYRPYSSGLVAAGINIVAGVKVNF